MEKKQFVLRPYTLQELAALYEVSKHTFLQWIRPYMDEIGERMGKTYTMLQVIKIVRRIGFPPRMIAAEVEAQWELLVKMVETFCLQPAPATVPAVQRR